MLIAHVPVHREPATGPGGPTRQLESMTARAAAGGAAPTINARDCLSQLLPAMSSWTGPHHLLRHEQQIPGIVPGRDFIGELHFDPITLGPDPNGPVLQMTEGLLTVRGASGGPLEMVMWHEPIIQAFRLDGVAEGANISIEHSAVEPITAAGSSAAAELLDESSNWPTERYLEWREYTGTDSGFGEQFVGFVGGWGADTKAVVESAVHRVAAAPARAGRWAIAKMGNAGMAIGKVVCARRARAPEHEVGPALWALLKAQGEALMPEIWEHDLRQGVSTRAGTQPACAVVLVHGTASSCGAGFKLFDWQALHGPGLRWHAFEHDTFQPIATNAVELARLVAEGVHCDRLLFLCHSRGGLVARFAARLLADDPKFTAAVEIFTCGTPHKGTPLVQDLATLLRPLVFAGGKIDGGIPVPSSGTAAIAYLASQMNRVPPGIAEMQPGLTALALLNQDLSAQTPLLTFGGVCDAARSARPMLALFRGYSDQALGDRHDGIVPLDSSLWAEHSGGAVEIAECSHFDYFAKDEVRRAVSSWLAACRTPRTDAARFAALKRKAAAYKLPGTRR